MEDIKHDTTEASASGAQKEPETTEIHSETEQDNAMESPQEESRENEYKDKFVRLLAEFDNFKRRNAKERLELLNTAGREIIVSLLEVLDDMDRAEKQMAQAGPDASLSEGTQLVFNKLRSTLQQKGLKAMESIGTAFDADKHEAITEIQSPGQEGLVVDELEKGYYLNDRIIRFAKVVVGK
jgi:molecular chaperone GrpE